MYDSTRQSRFFFHIVKTEFLWGTKRQHKNSCLRLFTFAQRAKVRNNESFSYNQVVHCFGCNFISVCIQMSQFTADVIQVYETDGR